MQSIKPIFAGLAVFVVVCTTFTVAIAQEHYDNWGLLKSEFESTGGGGIMIKGYNPVIVGSKCVTDFSAVEPGPGGNVYKNVVEFDAVATQGGTLCKDGKWRAVDGSASGTTPLQVFIKNGIARRSP